METFYYILAYTLIIFLSPLVSSIPLWLSLYLFSLIFDLKWTKLFYFANFLGSVLSTFFAVCFSIVIMKIFSLPANNLLLFILSLVFLQNGLGRLFTRKNKRFEWLNISGDLVWILIGGIIFIW